MADKEKINPDKMLSTDDLKQGVDPSPIVRKLKTENRGLRKRIDDLKLQLGYKEDFLEEVKVAISNINTIVPAKPKSPPKKKKTSKAQIGSPLSSVLMLSDWHVGEVVEADEIEGFNEFNWAITQRRVSYLIKKYKEWTKLWEALGTLNEIVVIVNGDMVSGDIHEELKVTNEFPVPVQCVRSGYLLADAIHKLSQEFENIRVEYVVPGNHDRLTRKPQFKKGGYNSYSYIVGKIAEERCRLLGNVEFNVYPMIKKLIDIGNTKYLVEHGNNIRGWSGFPWYGAERQVSREAQARMHMMDKQFHKIVIGHFHVPMNAARFLVNGSLSGTNEFDHGCGRHCDPCQTAWLVHPRYGEMNWTAFWVHYGDNADLSDDELILPEVD
jgi:hypothetical protein